ncbi:MAG TPA: nuclear transport factor 2 family protein [Actinomycetes bacterium]|nr:nuclear transport factor 2 family protein [Actinomycetes bacterium]
MAALPHNTPGGPADTGLDLLLARFDAAWTAGDIDTLMSLVTRDCVYFASVGPEPGTTYRGWDEVRRGFAEMLAYDRGRERRGGLASVCGDRAVAEWSFTETGADGRERVIRGCDIFEFAGGRICKKDAFRKVSDVEPRAVNQRSWVTAIPHADPAQAERHFADKLAHETDPADVWQAIESGTTDFVLVDCRPAGNYTKAHLPGAISLPLSEITAERIKDLPDVPVVTYCWGPSCNASTKGAHALAALGRRAKEMIGGLEYWVREGHPTEGKRPIVRGQERPSDWGLAL